MLLIILLLLLEELLITFIYGASIYYFLPLSLISMNFGMIGGIFLWILFGILLGFILLSRNVESLLQKFLTYTILFFTRSYTKLLSYYIYVGVMWIKLGQCMVDFVCLYLPKNVYICTLIFE